MLIPGSRTSLDFGREWERNILGAREREAAARRSSLEAVLRALNDRVARFLRRSVAGEGKAASLAPAISSVRDTVGAMPEIEPGSARP